MRYLVVRYTSDCVYTEMFTEEKLLKELNEGEYSQTKWLNKMPERYISKSNWTNHVEDFDRYRALGIIVPLDSSKQFPFLIPTPKEVVTQYQLIYNNE